MRDESSSANVVNQLGNPELRVELQQQIESHPQRRITFAAFMEQALYHPQYGYYSHRAQKIGTRGDFFTSPHLGSDFGQLLALQFVQMWQILGQPAPFTLVEMGAGQGLLAQDVLQWLQKHAPQCCDCLNYIIIEKSPSLQRLQQHQLSDLSKAVSIQWLDWDELADLRIVGCCFSNELVDAFAVHQVEFRQGQLQEVYVTFQDNQFVETVATPSTPALIDYFSTLGLIPTGEGYPDPYRTEVNLAALDWIKVLAQYLQQGYVLTIDYGYPAGRYYNRVRSAGTLQCYYQHCHHCDPYIHVGEQDITAHVNFTALELAGAAQGLETVGVTQQAMFLMALGLGERIAQLGRSDSIDPQEIMQRLRQRDALHQLMNPMGLGNFGVLLQSKALTPAQQAQTLKGFDTPIPFGL